MKFRSGKPKRKELITGVAWYRPEQWIRLVQTSSDKAAIEESYEAWLQNATARIEELAAAGWRLERVDVVQPVGSRRPAEPGRAAVYRIRAEKI